MNIAFFYHSLISDRNNGNAHFLRGIATEILKRGHTISIFEPGDAWSMQHLLHDHGSHPIQELEDKYPLLSSRHWHDTEHLFSPGTDYLIAHSSQEMREAIRDVVSDEELCRSHSEDGREIILRRHTCAHRVDELLAIVKELGHSVTIDKPIHR